MIEVQVYDSANKITHLFELENRAEYKLFAKYVKDLNNPALKLRVIANKQNK